MAARRDGEVLDLVERKVNLVGTGERAAARELIDRTLAAQLRPRTAATYSERLQHFARWCGCERVEDAIAALLIDRGRAHAVVLEYRSALAAVAAPATVNLALAALRAVVRVAQELGLLGWGLAVRGVRRGERRDTRGPELGEMRRILCAAAGQEREEVRARDVALLRLLFDLGLRRSEVCGLMVEDLDVGRGQARVRRKGSGEGLWTELPAETRSAIGSWLRVWGSTEGPLFVALDRGHRGAPLSESGLYHIVRRLGAAAGVTVRPHGVRHLAITTALEAAPAMGLGPAEVLAFSAHADGSFAVMLRYQDRRRGVRGQFAAVVAGRIPEAVVGSGERGAVVGELAEEGSPPPLPSGGGS